MTSQERYIHQVTDRVPRALPLRSQIAMELRSHIAERIAHGEPIDAVLRQLGDPEALAESYLSAVSLVSATFWQRALAKLIDFAIFAVLAVALWWALAERWPFAWLVIPAAVLSFVIYTIVAEAAVGQTIGKWLLGIRVVRESGARISAGQSIVRQLPTVLQVFSVDVLFALFTERSQRAFELLSKTRVVLAR